MLNKKKSRNRLLDRKINTAFLIYEQCRTLNLPIDAARVFVYIHFRIMNSLNMYINHSEIEKIIDFLIDNGRFDIFSEKSMRYNLIEDVPRRVKKLNGDLREDYDMKARVLSDLRNRVRIHRDSKYRKKMIALYRDRILPSLVDREVAF